jgi:Subtilase family
MPELPRILPHIYVENSGQSEPYTSKSRGNTPAPPQRERAAHAESLLRSLNAALGQVQAGIRADRAEDDRSPTGFVLEFRLPLGAEKFVEKLEDRRQHIEVLSVSDRGNDGLVASVYVPIRAQQYFLRKIEKYRDEETGKGRPKNEPVVARVDTIALGAFESVYTDDLDLLPGVQVSIWWEVWLRSGERPAFNFAAERLQIRISQESISFPEREVVLAFGSQASIGRCVVESGAIAEVRLAKDAPSLFLNLANDEQARWADDIAGRLVPPGPDAVAVCILDSGVTREHTLIRPALDPTDVHKYDPNWPDGDSAAWRGHGTAMAGLSLYGDLFPLMMGTEPINLTHRLEVVKMLAHDGQPHEPRLYGAITRECAARPEVVQPRRRRVHCLAVTGVHGTNRGRPSSWSAAIDQLAYGADDIRRLIVLAAGNIRDGITRHNYPDRNDVEPIENPAQAWNALTVGAFTEKNTLADPTFAGWSSIAPVGGIAPCSRTSVPWERKWPVKPDVVLEGGNWADFRADLDTPDDLSLLTTHYRPTIRQFEAFGDTSAAASLGAHLSAQIMSQRPTAWPETVRALVVHSAQWTPVMQAQMNQAANQTQRGALLRRYGYGVPRVDRAALSSLNDTTIVCEDSLRPLRLDGGVVKTQNMKLHQLPWPAEQLEALGTTEVQLRVTLSYFIEPNPGERGWKGRYRYPSHGLRFALKRGLESLPQFRARINRAVTLEEEDLATAATSEEDGWYLGKTRDVGSVHSDIWTGSAAELMRRNALAIYPVAGWWKEKPQLGRYNSDVRYSLCVSLRALEAEDIYTPIAIALGVPVPTIIGE